MEMLQAQPAIKIYEGDTGIWIRFDNPFLFIKAMPGYVECDHVHAPD